MQKLKLFSFIVFFILLVFTNFSANAAEKTPKIATILVPARQSFFLNWVQMVRSGKSLPLITEKWVMSQSQVTLRKNWSTWEVFKKKMTPKVFYGTLHPKWSRQPGKMSFE